MTMSEWARHEVKYAIDAANKDDGDLEYHTNCCMSALKAYECLCADHHTGSSMEFTKDILNRLINGRALLPIEDIPEVWKEVDLGKEREVKTYQCSRMMSLFKHVHKDGTIHYDDVERTVAVNMYSGATWRDEAASIIVDELYPIIMPYMPCDKPFEVYAEEFLTDRKNGDYDTIFFPYLITPGGECIKVDQYFKDDAGFIIEIDKKEFEERKTMHEARIKKEAEENAE